MSKWHKEHELLESDLQRAIIMWAKTQIGKYPELYWLHHCANGGKRDSREAQSLKSQGVVAGILDLSLDVARGGYNGFKLELKKPGGKCVKPSKEQAEYMAFCTEHGYFCEITNDFEQAKRLITYYLESRLIRG